MLKNAYFYFWEKQHFLSKKTASNEEQKSFWKFRNQQEHFKPDRYLKEKKEYFEIWDKLIENLDLKDKIIYDYGCGGGVWSKILRDKGAYVIGVDYARSNQDFCNEFIQADIKQFRAIEKADLINCCRVLIHMTHFEQERTLKLIKDNLKEDGYLLIIEKKVGISFQQFARDWKETAEFYGFKVIKYISNGVVQGVLCKA